METQQEAELSKQAIHFTSEIEKLRASNKELSDIVAEYRKMLDKIANPLTKVEHIDFKERYDQALNKLMGFKPIFGQFYWYKGSP